ncbi:MAG: hypothetical protein RLZZ337_1080 [Bacteroidota bacterium]|jgi:hypothetical protein
MLETNNDIDFASNNDIPINEVISQMEKELEMSGEHHHFVANEPLRLIDELMRFLKQIDTGTRLANLFYRIDVNPAKANEKLSHYEGLAVLAWNRVFQKVWFRKNYKP